jgi:hypothetical protein
MPDIDQVDSDALRPSSFWLLKELNCKIKPKLERTGFLSLA